MCAATNLPENWLNCCCVVVNGIVDPVAVCKEGDGGPRHEAIGAKFECRAA